jgi:hypothetical protein
MPIFYSEACLSVSDRHGDFDATANSGDTVASDFKNWAKTEANTEIEIVHCEFLEFDSNNSSHATAYFEICYKAANEISL